MLKGFFGEKKSTQRMLVITLIVASLIIIILTIAEFILFIEPAVKHNNLIEIGSVEDKNAIIYIIRRSFGFMIANIIIMSVILGRIYIAKFFKPINKITAATKKVSDGDYDIELGTDRKDEIGKLTENFNKMIKSLQSTEKLQQEFINNVSHEIKTPISSIEGFAKLLDDDNLSKEERKEYVNIIVEESKRLSDLTGKMLSLSKLHNQEKIINMQEFMISEQIRKAISILEPKWAKKDLKINVKLEEKMFLGDENLIFQVWMNILDNAIKFSNNNGKIDVVLTQEKDKIVVKIKDYGKGIPDDELEKVFERFYQIDKSHSEDGAGLGLAIVKRIIELSEGQIEIESKENIGTTVIVRLPALPKEDKMVYIK